MTSRNSVLVATAIHNSSVGSWLVAIEVGRQAGPGWTSKFLDSDTHQAQNQRAIAPDIAPANGTFAPKGVPRLAADDAVEAGAEADELGVITVAELDDAGDVAELADDNELML